MKILKIENGLGYYLDGKEEYSAIDTITKEDLLRMVNLTLEGEIECDEYNDSEIKNHAHQIIYKSVCEKLQGLKARKQEFKDQSDRLYLQEYEKYRSDSLQKTL